LPLTTKLGHAIIWYIPGHFVFELCLPVVAVIARHKPIVQVRTSRQYLR